LKPEERWQWFGGFICGAYKIPDQTAVADVLRRAHAVVRSYPHICTEVTEALRALARSGDLSPLVILVEPYEEALQAMAARGTARAATAMDRKREEQQRKIARERAAAEAIERDVREPVLAMWSRCHGSWGSPVTLMCAPCRFALSVHLCCSAI
jgi:hypothetical protein